MRPRNICTLSDLSEPERAYIEVGEYIHVEPLGVGLRLSYPACSKAFILSPLLTLDILFG